MPRKHRPAPNQLVFWFILAEIPIFPDAPKSARPRPRPASYVVPPTSRRERPEPARPSQERIDRTVTRWLRREAGCALCGRFPATNLHQIETRLLLLCRTCQAKPNSPARLREMVRDDWRADRCC
jgi:hypothetical protein